MSTVKLIYFASRGKAELIRLLLAESGTEFSEELIETKEQWETLKRALPYGQVPLLEIDGIKLVQSKAIVQYLARKFNYYGVTPHEAYKIDEIGESITDFLASIPTMAILTKTGDWQKALNDFKEGSAKKYFEIWNNQLAQKDNKQHLVGNTLSLADLNLFHILRNLADFDLFGPSTFEPYHHLNSFYHTTKARPNITKYLQSPHCFPWPPSPTYLEKIRSFMGQI